MLNSNHSDSRVTCIIPFFNEGTRVLHVLDTLSHSRVISQIVCVDDGSSDATYTKIQVDFPNVEVVRLDQNEGKSRAIAQGLEYAREDNVLLFDADLQEIDIAQLDEAISAFASSPWVDMMVLRRTNDLLVCRFFRFDIVLSGERLVRKQDLHHALESNPLGYQLELAINNYMETNDKAVCWMPLSSQHTVKISKSGLASGVVKEIEQHAALMRFNGARWYLWNLATFCFWEFGYEGNLIRAVSRAAA